MLVTRLTTHENILHNEKIKLTTLLFNPASTETFFFEFWSDFSVCFPLRPLDMRSERKNLLSIPEVCFLDATRFVCLVLTGVRVVNFFNITNFDLVFLHNTHILTVYLFVGLFVILFCLSCLFVCLCVCLIYSTVGMYSMCEYWSFCRSVCFSACSSTFEMSVCLSVCLCMSVRPYFYLSVCIFVHLSFCTSVCLSTCISAFLPSCVPSCLPACLSTCLTACLTSCLPSSLPSCLPSCLPACLPACLHACLPACPPTPHWFASIPLSAVTAESAVGLMREIETP